MQKGTSYGVWGFSLCVLLICYGVDIDARFKRRVLSPQPYRTAFHFQPSKNWMNDPNAPMYYKGVYHLFYQYNPYSALWGNITWGHSISYDLIDWLHLDIALVPSEPYDINGCWSGSATLLPNGEPMILYTGGDTHNHQVQNLAFPKNHSDPLLREWVKSSHNPLLTPPHGIDVESYRDPSTAWMGSDGEWRMVIGSEINCQGAAVLYKSKDFSTWTECPNPLHMSNKTGIWECPDFFPVSVHSQNGLDTSVEGEDVKHVLKASFDGKDYYIIGMYDPKTDRYVCETDFMDRKAQFQLDYGRFYASKSFYDGDKRRRILWSWINEGESEKDDVKKGWSGLQSLPRSMWLSKGGDQLIQWPVKELEKLRTRKVHIANKQLKGGDLYEISGITASQADVEVAFSLSNLDEAEPIDSDMADPQLLCAQKNASVRGSFGPFGLLVLASDSLIEQTAVFFRVFKGPHKFHVLMCADQSRSSLRPEVDKAIYGAFLPVDPLHDKISLRTLIDHSIVESFGGEGLTCITARVYPKLAIDEQARLYAFNNGSQSLTISSLNAWSMDKAQIAPIGKRRKPIK